MDPVASSIETFVDRQFGENAYVVHGVDDDGRPGGWAIDPSFSPQSDRLVRYVADQGIRLERIVLTHGHIDHVAGVDAVREAHPQARLCLAEPDQPMLADARLNLSAPFGLAITVQAEPDEDLAPGAELTLGRALWRVLDTSGHSPGGRSLYCPGAGVVLSGDALFADNIGRTDLPGSDSDRLIANIRTHLFGLPDETVVYAGHGPTTTIGNERKSNPFVSEG